MIDILHIEGFAVRPVEEDVDANDAPEIEIKAAKGAAKKKKK